MALSTQDFEKLKAQLEAKNNPVSASGSFDVLGSAKDAYTGLKTFYGGGEQGIANKLKQDVQAGAKDIQEGNVLKGIAKSGLRTAADVAGTIYAPIGAAIQATGFNKLTDWLGEKIANSPLGNVITDIPAVQEFAMKHPNAGEDFGRALTLVMASMDKGKIDPKTIVDRTITQFTPPPPTIKVNGKSLTLDQMHSSEGTKLFETLNPKQQEIWANFDKKNSLLRQIKNEKSLGKDVTDLQNVYNSEFGLKTKATNLKNSIIGNKDSKILQIFTGESEAVVNKALQNPEIADIGIKGGDVALRNAVIKGGESSIQAKNAFIKGHSEAVKQVVGDAAGKVSRQKVLYQFVDDLKANGVEIKNGKANFTTSKINTNPGEVSKIISAYKAIQNWKDWSPNGVHELKQLVGNYTKFANEAGGTSKSPFLGKFYNYLDNTVKSNLSPEKASAYTKLNEKFSSNIGLYDDMVDAFNSGDPFTKLTQLFGSNKDSLRQVVDFYETTTGNKISPIVAGRGLAESKPAAFGFLNPRQWIDFFVDPKTQASLVTKYGARKLQKQTQNK
jgi:hypothetical protein